MKLNAAKVTIACLLCVLITVHAADDRPNFMPCAMINSLLGLPPANYIPCSLFRGARFFRDHYRRGLRMLMKNHRKSLSRNKVINALSNPAKVTETLKKLATVSKVMF